MTTNEDDAKRMLQALGFCELHAEESKPQPRPDSEIVAEIAGRLIAADWCGSTNEIRQSVTMARAILLDARRQCGEGDTCSLCAVGDFPFDDDGDFRHFLPGDDRVECATRCPNEDAWRRLAAFHEDGWRSECGEGE